MKILIGLAKDGRGGAIAYIENEYRDDTIDIHHEVGTTEEQASAMEACYAASWKLRQMANAFERLSNEEFPYRDETHCRVNKRLDHSL